MEAAPECRLCILAYNGVEVVNLGDGIWAVPLLRNAGQALSRLSVPDVKRHSGSKHKDNLVDYLIRVLHVPRQSTPG